MAAEWTLPCFPDEHLVLVQNTELACRDASTSPTFPTRSPTLHDSLERSISEHMLRTQCASPACSFLDAGDNTGVLPGIPDEPRNGRRLDCHPDSFEDPRNLGHVFNRREQSVLDFETVEKALIEWLKEV
jgi:hypothetical protein